MPADRHSPDPYRCAGCGEPTVCAYGEQRVPLCPGCLETLQERPELRRLLLAEPPGQPS
jgi:hypothetical protein